MIAQVQSPLVTARWRAPESGGENTMNKRNTVLFVATLTLLPAVVTAQQSVAEPKISAAAEMQWKAGPATLPTRAQIVVLDGDPTKPGPFTIRLKIPPGYQIPPHTHPAAAERITVISGTVRLGIGEKFDGSGGRELKAGDFAVVPAGVPHFASASSEAVLQIHSEGPFERKFVDPAHDAANR